MKSLPARNRAGEYWIHRMRFRAAERSAAFFAEAKMEEKIKNTACKSMPLYILYKEPYGSPPRHFPGAQLSKELSTQKRNRILRKMDLYTDLSTLSTVLGRKMASYFMVTKRTDVL